MNTNWRVEIRSKPATLTTEIFIFFHNQFNNKISILRRTGLIEDLDAGVAVPPSFEVENEILPVLLQALMKHGVESPKESFTEGELKATKGHLSDLRQLLKLKSPLQ